MLLLLGTQKMNGVHVRNVNPALIRLWAVAPILVDKHSEEQHILRSDFQACESNVYLILVIYMDYLSINCLK